MPNTNNAAIVPSSAQPIADRAGRITPVWQRFFNVIARVNPPPISAVMPTGSPFTFRAGAAGSLSVSGGTVSGITLTRTNTTVTLATAGVFPVSNGDVVAISYSVEPIVSFIPS